jgi:hypothetical protein
MLRVVTSIVALTLFAAPLVVEAQPQGKIPLVGVLRPNYASVDADARTS